MKSAEVPDYSEWMEARIEPYLDGELTAAELEQFEQLLRQDENWERELAWAVNIRDALRSKPDSACPPEVLATVMRQARRDLWHARLNRIKSLLTAFGGVSWRPAMAVVILMVAGAVIFSGRVKNDAEAVSQAEVEQALAEVKWTLGYVSKTGRITGSSVNDALTPLRKTPPAEE